MRRIALWFASTATVVVMLFGYHTSLSGVSAAGSQPPVVSGSPTGGSSAQPAGSTGGSHHAAGKAMAAPVKTYTGNVAQTQYGPVQVAVDVRNGKVTKVSVLQYPSSNSVDQQIAQFSLPVLNREAIATQSSHIHMVSGATYTSGGYIQSLQSALDQAGV
jgi:uncharacterized protein with FMN-binding domain